MGSTRDEKKNNQNVGDFKDGLNDYQGLILDTIEQEKTVDF